MTLPAKTRNRKGWFRTDGILPPPREFVEILDMDGNCVFGFLSPNKRFWHITLTSMVRIHEFPYWRFLTGAKVE